MYYVLSRIIIRGIGNTEREETESAGRPAVAEEVVDLGGIIFGFYCRTRETHTAAAAAGRVSDSGA